MRKKLHTKYNSRVTNIISLLCGYIGHGGLIAEIYGSERERERERERKRVSERSECT